MIVVKDIAKVSSKSNRIQGVSTTTPPSANRRFQAQPFAFIGVHLRTNTVYRINGLRQEKGLRVDGVALHSSSTRRS
jgi:hypothetical protein